MRWQIPPDTKIHIRVCALKGRQTLAASDNTRALAEQGRARLMSRGEKGEDCSLGVVVEMLWESYTHPPAPILQYNAWVLIQPADTGSTPPPEDNGTNRSTGRNWEEASMEPEHPDPAVESSGEALGWWSTTRSSRDPV